MSTRQIQNLFYILRNWDNSPSSKRFQMLGQMWGGRRNFLAAKDPPSPLLPTAPRNAAGARQNHGQLMKRVLSAQSCTELDRTVMEICSGTANSFENRGDGMRGFQLRRKAKNGHVCMHYK
jgi:hypothetical protein